MSSTKVGDLSEKYIGREIPFAVNFDETLSNTTITGDEFIKRLFNYKGKSPHWTVLCTYYWDGNCLVDSPVGKFHTAGSLIEVWDGGNGCLHIRITLPRDVYWQSTVPSGAVITYSKDDFEQWKLRT